MASGIYKKCAYAADKKITSRGCIEISRVPVRQLAQKCKDCESPWRVCLACILQLSKRPGFVNEIGGDPARNLCAFHAQHGAQEKAPAPSSIVPHMDPVGSEEEEDDKRERVPRVKLSREKKIQALREAVAELGHDVPISEVARISAEKLGANKGTLVSFITSLPKDERAQLGIKAPGRRTCK